MKISHVGLTLSAVLLAVPVEAQTDAPWSLKGPDPRGWIAKAEAELIELGTPVPGASANGHLTYALPIALPSGYAPEVSLTYRSTHEEGLPGVGWRLTGFPAIVRIHDDTGLFRSATARYAFSPQGPNALPSSDLLLVPDQLSSGRFRLQRDDGTRFEPSSADCAGQPCYWVRLLPNGHRESYGAFAAQTIDAQPTVLAPTQVQWNHRPTSEGTATIRAYGLAEGSDPHGNSFRVEYHSVEFRELLPLAVTYPHHPDEESTDLRTVEFVYSTRFGMTDHNVEEIPRGTESVEQHIRKRTLPGPAAWSALLTRITVETDSVVDVTEIFHDASPASGRPLLTSVKRPDHPDLEFDYGSGAPGGPTMSASGGRATSLAAHIGGKRDGTTQNIHSLKGRLALQSVLADINDDGFVDMVRAFRGGVDELDSQRGDWAYRHYVELALGGPGGLGDMRVADDRDPGSISSDPSGGAPYQIAVGDMDNDGKDDIFLWKGLKGTSSAKLHILAYSGASLAEVTPSIPLSGPDVDIEISLQGVPPQNAVDVQVSVTDLNRDGVSDLVVYEPFVPYLQIIAGGGGLQSALGVGSLSSVASIAGAHAMPVDASTCRYTSFGCYPDDFTYFRGATLSDLNGDEYPDIAFLYSTQGTKYSNQFSMDQGCPQGGCSPSEAQVQIRYALGSPIGFGPMRLEATNHDAATTHQLVTGDFDGDGRGDLAALWLREGDFQGHLGSDPNTWRYYPNYYRSALFFRGRRFDRGEVAQHSLYSSDPSHLNPYEPDMTAMAQEGDLRENMIPTSLVYFRGNEPNRAQSRVGQQEALVADFNGDGLADIAFATRATSRSSQLSGPDIAYGELVDVAYGRRQDWTQVDARGPVESIQRQPIPAVDPKPVALAHMGVWRHNIADVNGDGLSDVVRWMYSTEGVCQIPADCPGFNLYLDSIGLKVEVALGSASGLKDFDRNWFHDSTARPSKGYFPENAHPHLLHTAFPSLHVGDVNGDGVDDLIFVDDTLQAFGTNPPAAPPVRSILSSITTEPVDLLVSFENGYGATFEADYASGGRTALEWTRSNDGPHNKESTTCSGSSCGRPQRRAEYLLAHLTTKDGRGDPASDRSSSFSYSDRRVWRGRWPLQRDLGFATYRTLDHAYGGSVLALNRQDPPYEGLPDSISGFDDQGDIAWTSQLQYDQAATERVLRVGREDLLCIDVETHEDCRDAPAHQRTWTVTSFDAYGRIEDAVGCIDDDCTLTQTAWQTDTSLWLMSLPEMEVAWTVRRAEDGSFQRTALRAAERRSAYYGRPALTQKIERLLFNQASAAICQSTALDATFCQSQVASQDARWVSVWRVPSPLGIMVDDAYDPHGNVVTSYDALNRKSTARYDSSSWTLAEGFENALSQSFSTVYDAYGRATVKIDPNGEIIYHDYDDAGRKVAERRHAPWETLSSSEYLSLGAAPGVLGQRIRSTTPFTAGDSEQVTQYFDGAGFPYREFHEGQSSYVDREVGFRTEGGRRYRFARVSEPYSCAAGWGLCDSDRTWLEVVYDSRERPFQVYRKVAGAPDRLLGSYEYTSRTIDNVRATCVRYEDELEYPTEICSDGSGRPLLITDAESEETSYHYDELRNLERVVLPGSDREVSFERDGWGRVTAQNHWQTGRTSYSWDDAGQLTREVDADGKVVELEYDDIGRRTIERHASSPSIPTTQVNRWVYDLSGTNEIGRLSEVSFPAGKRTYDYDDRGHLVGETLELNNWMGSGPRSFSFVFASDRQGRVGKTTFPGGEELVTNYKPNRDLMDTVSLSGQPIVTSVDYDPFGRVEAISYANGTTSERGWDPVKGFASFRKVDHPASGVTYLEEEYEHDWAGNLKSVLDKRTTTRLNGVETSASRSFTYDRRHSVESFRRSLPGAASVDYQIDGAGELVNKGGVRFNWESCGSSGPSRCLRGYDGPTATAPLIWEAQHTSGGLRERANSGASEWRYVYDASERLTRAELFHGMTSHGHVEYEYDETRSRLTKSMDVPGAPPVTTLYVGHGYEIRVDRTNPSVESRTIYIVGPDGLAATKTFGPGLAQQPDAQPSPPMAALVGDSLSGPARGLTFHHTDRLGSPTLVTNEVGDVVARYLYEPYGDVVRAASVGLDATPRKFTGHEEDADTKLVYMQSRTYDPFSGRFLGPDLLTPGGGLDPRGFNRYTYVLGNPLRFIDPDGNLPSNAQTAYLRGLKNRIARDEAIRLETGVHPKEGVARMYTVGLVANLLSPLIAVLPEFAGLTGAAATVSGGALEGAFAVLASDAATGQVSSPTDYAKGALLGAATGGALSIGLRAGGAAWRRLGSRFGCSFPQGTLVATALGGVPIEDVHVGMRVTTVSEESTGELGADWMVVRLRVDEADGGTLISELLRPRAWLREHEMDTPGEQVFMDMPELGVHGTGVIEAIRPAKAIPGGAGRVVLGTFEHFDVGLFEVSFAERHESLSGTGRHPLYSLDREDWVEIQDLQLGERLQTAEGAVTVEALEKVRGVHRVYNLEVEGDHEYLVGETGVRAHNTCWKSTKTFGHTFKTHGAGAKNTRSLTDRAHPASKGKPQGQWLDNQRAADLIESVHGPANAQGEIFFDIPDGLGQVILPDGSVRSASRGVKVLRPDGSINTAYPLPDQ